MNHPGNGTFSTSINVFLSLLQMHLYSMCLCIFECILESPWREDCISDVEGRRAINDRKV